MDEWRAINGHPLQCVHHIALYANLVRECALVCGQYSSLNSIRIIRCTDLSFNQIINVKLVFSFVHISTCNGEKFAKRFDCQKINCNRFSDFHSNAINNEKYRRIRIEIYLLHYQRLTMIHVKLAPYHGTLDARAQVDLAFDNAIRVRQATGFEWKNNERLVSKIQRGIFRFQFTRKNVLPSSRNSRNGTSESIGFRSSVQPTVVKYWAPDTAQTGDFTSE